ncbi:MAG: TIGR02281 family clan AA aspartic protease [Terracidiphilus sp.]
MSILNGFASIVLAATFVSAASAEAHCPGNVASITPRMVQGALIVIPVMINNAGPFDFMVDTGSQIVVVDPSLAAQLHLKIQGTVGLVSAANYAAASVTILDTLEAGSHRVEKPVAAVEDLGQIQAADSRIRGVLGQSFLTHFDMLIDNEHKLLCLDETHAMQEKVRGEHIQLVAPPHAESELPYTERLELSVRLSGIANQQLLLQLDSGSDGPILYPSADEAERQILKQATRRSGNASNAQQAFADLPPQEMRIGTHTVSQVYFVTPVNVGLNIPTRDEAGLLPTVLFKRVYINHADHFAVIEPW